VGKNHWVEKARNIWRVQQHSVSTGWKALPPPRRQERSLLFARKPAAIAREREKRVEWEKQVKVGTGPSNKILPNLRLHGEKAKKKQRQKAKIRRPENRTRTNVLQKTQKAQRASKKKRGGGRREARA